MCMRCRRCDRLAIRLVGSVCRQCIDQLRGERQPVDRLSTAVWLLGVVLYAGLGTALVIYAVAR